MIRALFAVRCGDPDYAEVLITEVAERIPDAKIWARANGFDRLREIEIDETVAPDFSRTIA